MCYGPYVMVWQLGEEGMAQRAAQKWREIAAKENVKWMFDDYHFSDDDRDILKDMYIEHELNMTETLTVEQYISHGELNKTLKSILVEIPISIARKIWLYISSPIYVLTSLVSKRLSGVEAFGDLFKWENLNFVLHCDNEIYPV